ncbi:MAG: hypothetical protein WBI55_05020 [Eubacteriales bacterium]|jgi:hypothetical protein|nr:hypothetical protein [Clostridiales bacterium]
MSYSLYRDGEKNLTSTTDAPNCTIKTASVPVSGVVYKDYDDDGVRDANEQDNMENYTVLLYSGSYTSGTTGLTQIASNTTNYNTGAYSFAYIIYKPGTYTLSVRVPSTQAIGAYAGICRRLDF